MSDSATVLNLTKFHLLDARTLRLLAYCAER